MHNPHFMSYTRFLGFYCAFIVTMSLICIHNDPVYMSVVKPEKVEEVMRSPQIEDSKPILKPVVRKSRTTEPSSIIYYFTHYDLWDVRQNDSQPCKGASGVDLCYLERNGIHTMALTADIRKKLGVKFGDKVKLTGAPGCAGTYEVHDEMNKRFRTSCIMRPRTSYCIKWDLSNRPGGACSVEKIQY